MPVPKILLISRSAINDKLPELEAYLSITPIKVAIAQCDDDNEAAKKLCDVVGRFENVTAIVGDFIGCMAVNDDGSVEPICLPEPPMLEEEPLIKVVSI